MFNAIILQWVYGYFLCINVSNILRPIQHIPLIIVTYISSFHINLTPTNLIAKRLPQQHLNSTSLTRLHSIAVK